MKPLNFQEKNTALSKMNTTKNTAMNENKRQTKAKQFQTYNHAKENYRNIQISRT